MIIVCSKFSNYHKHLVDGEVEVVMTVGMTVVVTTTDMNTDMTTEEVKDIIEGVKSH
jgi:hypothetical protein